eukprot:CAMPEP_0116879132 /NCGR_PEP_ID=MMETSP0463-20121206/10892_1 /TAXON_ID=181622 /ORGANISM="Strombidinopsis sp, Strain SopsisLIS2011" /LENGTH=54 /DNA_ID=CAMNT_0004528067 /DNA_START=368 /DNA_END=532 /DNA_ORIENTATION=-
MGPTNDTNPLDIEKFWKLEKITDKHEQAFKDINVFNQEGNFNDANCDFNAANLV